MGEAFTGFKDGEEAASRLDSVDPLASLRQKFEVPQAPGGGEAIYLCGNSLGLMPRTARREVEAVLDQWSRLGVRGHHRAEPPWYAYHEALTAPTAALLGAEPDEVVSMNSLTANLHLMLASFYRPTPQRHRIIIEAQAFPSDRYALASQIRYHGLDPASSLVELAPPPGASTLGDDELDLALRQNGEQVALILLGGVQYLTGQLFDLERVCRTGREIGAVVGLDLAHAAGNVPLQLHNWGPDFAVWCGYKYLNGGPGAPAGCFVHGRHGRDFAGPRLSGWWGHDPATRFHMGPEFMPQPGAAGWQLSNPPILSMAALKASLDLFHQVGMAALRAKSEQLTGFLHQLLSDPGSGLEVLTPVEPARRGCQLSIRVPGGAGALERDLRAAGIICDSREPDVLRVAPVPFYNTFKDAWMFARELRQRLTGVGGS